MSNARLPNLFRKTYRELTPLERHYIDLVKTKAEELSAAMVEAENRLVDGSLNLPDDAGRYGDRVTAFSNAEDRLKEVVFWATNAITG